MPRALALRYVTVADDARRAYLAHLADRVASARAAAFHLWAFEAAGTPGRFVEFVETGNPTALAAALRHDDSPGEAWERFDGVADS